VPVGQTQRASSGFIVFENFEKMNTQASRLGMPEKQLYWQENLQAVAENKLVTVPAAAPAALATLGANVQSLFAATIGGVDYIIAFTTDGAAYAVNVATGLFNNFAPPGTFTNPDCTTWQAARILINDPTAGYCTWDGTAFVKSGGVSPVFNVTNGGSGYSSAPPVTISGGSGSGATAHSVVVAGVVVAVVLDNPGMGYKATDTLTVSFGTGVGSGATGHVTMTGFNIASITINNQGSFSSPTFGAYAASFSGGGGSGATGLIGVSTNFPNSFVSSATVQNGGSGYTSPPTVTISGGTSGGTAPVLVANLGTEAVATIVRDAGGSGYVAPPTVTISGGNPAVAATAHATISGGAVNALVLDTAGSGYTSTPTVIIGTGSGAAAIGHVWPFVPTGTTLAVFQGRVWLGGGVLLQWTGTQGYDDFAAGNGSASLNITDADLVHAITALRSLNNYLFIFGDQSVKQIGNITVSGTTTLFTIITLTSDVGTIYPQACASFNRVAMFLNPNGIYAVLGSSVQKISDDMDGIFAGINFTQPPVAALIDLNGQHQIGWLIRYADAYTGTTRSLIITFTGKRWFVLALGESLVSIVATSTLASGARQLYGSTTADVTQLLARASTPVAFRIQSSLSHHGNAVQLKKMIRAGFAYRLTGTGSITQKIETELNTATASTLGVSRALASGHHVLGYADQVDLSGVYLGETLTGTLANFYLFTMGIEFQDSALWPNK